MGCFSILMWSISVVVIFIQIEMKTSEYVTILVFQNNRFWGTVWSNKLIDSSTIDENFDQYNC